MTSAVAVIGLEYDGVDLQVADLSVFFEIRRGVNEMSAVRGVDVVVPARAGRIPRSRVLDMLQIELYGHVTTDPTETTPAGHLASYRANWQGVQALFAPDRDPADLVATLEDGSTQSISARPLNIVVPNSIPGWFANVSIELEGFGTWEVDGS